MSVRVTRKDLGCDDCVTNDEVKLWGEPVRRPQQYSLANVNLLAITYLEPLLLEREGHSELRSLPDYPKQMEASRLGIHTFDNLASGQKERGYARSHDCSQRPPVDIK
jgi:hypothetical protein